MLSTLPHFEPLLYTAQQLNIILFTMNTSKVLILAGAIMLIGAGCAGVATNTPNEVTPNSAAGTQPAGTPYVDDTPAAPEALPTAPTNTKEAGTPNPIAVGEQNPATPTSVIALPSGGTFEAYNESKLANAENGDVVLFFHAAWCPSCRALENDITANAANIPDDLTILKLDYDTESALKKKYGVRSQHSLVQVDSDGNLISIWRGGNRLSDLVKQVQ